MPDDKKIYQVKANEFLFSFSEVEICKADIVKLPSCRYSLISDHCSVTATIIESDSTGKKIRVEMDGDVFTINIKDELDQVLDQMGFGPGSNKLVKEIKAPMPGLVLEIAVANGQEVNEGDKILILEAMKMENNIMIHTNAKIKKVAVEAGQAVEKGQVLVELE